MPLAVGSTSVVYVRLGTQSVTGRLGSTLVTVSVPGAPTIATAFWTGTETVVDISAPASDGGSSITSYEFTFDGVAVVPTTVDDAYRFAANYTGQAARARAVNAIGDGPYSEPVTVEVV